MVTLHDPWCKPALNSIDGVIAREMHGLLSGTLYWTVGVKGGGTYIQPHPKLCCMEE